ncbi:MAG: YitT family protein [Flavobacteriales bacterium]
MQAFIRDLVIRFVIRPRQPDCVDEELSAFVIAKGFRELKLTAWNAVKDTIQIGLGVFCAAFGLESFLLPSGFIDGGATGVALMAAQVTGISLPVLLALINIPFVYLAYRIIGKPFAIRTALGIMALAVVVATVHMPEVTHDKLLVAVFGGFFLGAGIGLAVRGGGVIDGTEVLAIAVSRRMHTTVGDVITVMNVGIFAVAAYLLSIETALYSLITYLAASRTMDFVIEGIEEYTGVTIISSHHEEIRTMITDELQRGITVLRGRRGVGTHGPTHDADVLYCVITRLEVGQLTDAIEKIDPNAFVVMSPVKDITGGLVKKRRHKH